jgi:uncharacterized membrane protein YqgA involved in biofilm formation
MWQQIIQDPKSLVATVALVTNIAVTVISIWLNNIWFVKRKIDEREYDKECDFYKMCVLEKVGALIGYPCEIRKRFNELVTECHKVNERKEDVLPTVQNAQEWLDEKHREICHSTMPHVKGYANGLHDELSRIEETFYDNTTNVFSKLNRQEITHEFERTIGNHVVGEATKFVEDVFACIKKHSPKKC